MSEHDHDTRGEFTGQPQAPDAAPHRRRASRALATVDQAPPPSAPAPTEVSLLTSEAFVGLVGLGERPFTKKQADVLLAPARDEEIDVLPTGELYGAQVHVRRRFNLAFGPGGWGMRPLQSPVVQGSTLTQQWGLICAGRWVAMAAGEADYKANNPRISWATTLESVKSNALTRASKDLGVLSECWDRRWADAWRARNCIKVYRRETPRDEERRNERWQWRRKDAPPFWDEAATGDPRDQHQAARARQGYDDSYAGHDRPPATGAARQPTTAASAERRISDDQRSELFTLTQRHNVTKAAFKAHLVALNVEAGLAANLPARLYESVVAWVKRGGR